MTSVTDALRQTPKGKLSYDTKWREEGRTEVKSIYNFKLNHKIKMILLFIRKS